MSKWQQYTYDVIERATRALTSTDDLPAAHAHLRDAAESIGRALGALENDLDITEEEPNV